MIDFKMLCSTFLIYGFIFFSLTSVECADVSDIARLRATILRNYDSQTRPVQNHQDATHVIFSFFYMGFEFDEHKGKLTLHLQTVMHWKDEHVSWNPLDYGNLSEITFAENEIWKPDISVINKFVQNNQYFSASLAFFNKNDEREVMHCIPSKKSLFTTQHIRNEHLERIYGAFYDESEIDHFGNVLILAVSDSSVWWIPPTKFQVGCITDFRLWPYDQQTCTIYVASWSHQGSELNMSIAENYTQLDQEFMNGTENREWKLAGNSVQRSSQVLYCCPEVTFVNLQITVDLERRSSTHTAAVSVVGLGIAMAILVSFWLDPFANERIPLTLLVMLLNALYLQNMHRTIPNNGATVPLAICFFRDSLIMVTFAFGWTVLIRYLAKTKQNSPVSLPDPVEKLLNSYGATILCINPRPQSKGQSEKSRGESTEDGGDVSELVEDDGSSHKEDWEWLARLLDRIAFFAYFIAYIIFISAFL